MEKMKKTAIFLSLKRANAFNPNASEKLFFSSLLLVGHFGKVNEYTNSTIPKIPDTKNCE